MARSTRANPTPRRGRDAFTKRGGYEASKPVSQFSQPKGTGSTGAGAGGTPTNGAKK